MLTVCGGGRLEEEGGPGRGGDTVEGSAGGAASSGQVSRRPGEVSIKYLSRLGEGTV